MASLISGYKYDIFISYRQKDNKGDRWVSEFVEALKTELESTFKEEISVYFDINPHDGLLETHDVDASLKEKLKCLIFIPIISRTYCDPNSFAWEHEFKAFVEQASRDQYGLKVKLPNGNIANRVLPVRIHDLDINDIKLCESIIGGVLRDIEFIYRSSEGVNRPLRSKEDKPDENLNKTIYRDQVNKMALAIKEIILGLKGEPDRSVEKSSEHREQEREFYEVKKPARLRKNKLLIVAGILAILIITSILAYPKIFKRDQLERLRSRDGRIPIAVMPFQNMTNDTLWDVWQDGIQNILIINLSNSEELKVRQVEAISDILQGKGLSDYASLTPSVTSSISKYLGANVHITGSIKQSGSIVRLNAQLVNSKTGEAIKSFQINGIPDSILPVIDSLSVMVKNFLAISKIEKEISPDMQYYTNSPEAYKYHILAEKARSIDDLQTAIKYLSKAIAIDSNFVAAMIFLSMRYEDLVQYDDAKKWCLKAYEKRDQVPMYAKPMLEWHHARLFETPNEEIKYLKQFQDFDLPPVGYLQMGNTYSRLLQYDKAIFYYEKALEIYNKWGSKPLGVFNYTVLGSAYHKTGKYKKEEKIYEKAERDFPDEPSVVYRQAILSLTEGDTVAANRLLKKYISICRNQSMTEVTLQLNLGHIYEEAGILDKAELIYRQLISSAPEGPYQLYRLARLLIDKDRNITEGLELIDKALAIRPDNYNFLDIKGWGLYKQGKFEEAQDILQRSWNLRRKNAIYNHEAFLHLEAAKKAVAGLK